MGSHHDSLFAAAVVFLVLNSIVVFARVYVRTVVIPRAFGWDDFVLCLTYVSMPFATALRSECHLIQPQTGWFRDLHRAGFHCYAVRIFIHKSSKAFASISQIFLHALLNARREYFVFTIYRSF